MIDRILEDVILAATRCNGTYVDLAKKLSIGDSATAKRILHRHPEAVAIFEERKAALLDEAEHVLIEKLRSDNEQTSMKCAMFILEKIPNERFCGQVKKEDSASILIQILNGLEQHQLSGMAALPKKPGKEQTKTAPEKAQRAIDLGQDMDDAESAAG